MATMTEQHLALAERHLVEAEARVARQRVLIEELATDGHDTHGAETLLATLLAAMDGMRAHRTILLAEVAAAHGKPTPD